MLLENKFKTEAEEKKLVQDTQRDIRKGRITMDNVHILNYIVERKKAKKRSKLYVFADLKETNRRDIRRNMDKIEDEVTETIWTEKGVRK